MRSRDRPAQVLPITAPGRAELWARVQLARALLNHRLPTAETRDLVLRALDGEQIEHMKGAS